MIPPEVYDEIVTAGAARPGALGPGEVAAIRLAIELNADLLLVDDNLARLAARASGLTVRGTIGVLEVGFQKGYLTDLRHAFLRLREERVFAEPELLNVILESHGLARL